METLIEPKTNWNEMIRKLKQKFNLLPITELAYVEGKQNESFNKLQVIFGKSKEDMNALISNL
jgi:hypothetical protein